MVLIDLYLVHESQHWLLIQLTAFAA